MILTQLFKPEELARLSAKQLNILLSTVYVEIMSNEEIKATLRKTVTPAYRSLLKTEGK